MRKIIILLSIFSILVLLSGCISIPLGDGGTLEVSKDGLTIDEGKVASDSIEEEEIEEVEAAELEIETSEEDLEDGEANTPTNAAVNSSNGCDDLIEDTRANDRHMKKLIELTPDDYPIAECMIMSNVTEEYQSSYEAEYVSADYYVEGYWADITDEFIDYFKDNGFASPTVNESASESKAYVSSKDADFDVDLTINQVEPGEDGSELVRIRLSLYHYDTAREE